MKKILFILIFLIAFPAKADKIGWITDIHAGNTASRKAEFDTVYPKKSLKQFKKFVKLMAKQKVKYILITGDMTQKSSDKKSLKKIGSIASKKKINLLLVKGNHDSNLPENHYYRDIGDSRLIVLNSRETDVYYGGISQSQIDWLKNIISQTDKRIVIAMHNPIFDKYEKELIPQYTDFLATISDTSVNLVLSGHYHYDFSKNLNGIDFKTQKSFCSNKGVMNYQILEF